jgi:hypothetical protein
MENVAYMKRFEDTTRREPGRQFRPYGNSKARFQADIIGTPVTRPYLGRLECGLRAGAPRCRGIDLVRRAPVNQIPERGQGLLEEVYLSCSTAE